MDGQIKCFAGTHLKALLRWARLEADSACKCSERAALMDAWGCDECERRLDEIVGWLREESTRRGLPFVDAVGRMLVSRAIKLARESALAQHKATE